MKERIRVVELIYGFGIENIGGGAERFAIALGQNLDASQFDVEIWGLWDRGTFFEQKHIAQLKDSGLKTVVATYWDEDHPVNSLWRAYQEMQRMLLTRPYHILHSHSQFGDILAVLCKMLSKVPVVVRTVHHGYHLEWSKKPLRRLLLTNLLYPVYFDAEIGVSPSVAANLDRRWLAKVLNKHSRCIYNAIDLQRFSPSAVHDRKERDDLGIPPDAIVIGSVGRLVEGKGYDTLLKAAAIVLKVFPEAFFLLVGNGNLLSHLIELANQLEIAERVMFTGPRFDVEDIFTYIDLFVLPSLWEGLPTVILESIASGVPVIATNIPGIRRLIHDRETGWLVPVNQPSVLADTIIKAIRSPVERLKYAQCAANTLLDEFSIINVAKIYEDLYREFLNLSDSDLGAQIHF